MGSAREKTRQSDSARQPSKEPETGRGPDRKALKEAGRVALDRVLSEEEVETIYGLSSFPSGTRLYVQHGLMQGKYSFGGQAEIAEASAEAFEVHVVAEKRIGIGILSKTMRVPVEMRLVPQGRTVGFTGGRTDQDTPPVERRLTVEDQDQPNLLQFKDEEGKIARLSWDPAAQLLSIEYDGTSIVLGREPPK